MMSRASSSNETNEVCPAIRAQIALCWLKLPLGTPGSREGYRAASRGRVTPCEMAGAGQAAEEAVGEAPRPWSAQIRGASPATRIPLPGLQLRYLVPPTLKPKQCFHCFVSQEVFSLKGEGEAGLGADVNKAPTSPF